MTRLRAFWGMLAVSAALAGGWYITSGSLGGQVISKAHVMDRRCRGGCTDTALLRILPGGSGPIATGSLSGSKGQVVTTTRASNKTCTTAAGTLVYLTSNQPCVESQGLLVEGASTNLILQSSDLSNAAWTKSNSGAVAPTVTANACTAPDGTLTASRVDFPATSAGQFSIIYQSFTATAAGYAASIYAEAISGTPSTQIFMSPNGVTGFIATMSPSTTGWTRYSASGTLTAATWFIEFGNDSRQTGTPAFSAGSFCLAAGQFEAQPFATSYIPTVAASASRAADLVSTTNPLPNSSAPWCVYETVTPESGRAWNSLTGNAALWSFGTYAAANSAWGQLHSNGNIYMTVYDSAGGSLQGNAAYSFGAGTSHRIGQCNTDVGGQQFYFDGVSQSVALGGPGTGVTSAQSGNFYLGGQSLGGFQLAGYITDVCLGAPGACR